MPAKEELERCRQVVDELVRALVLIAEDGPGSGAVSLSECRLIARRAVARATKN